MGVLSHSLKNLYGISIALTVRSFDRSLFTQLIAYLIQSRDLFARLIPPYKLMRNACLS